VDIRIGKEGLAVATGAQVADAASNVDHPDTADALSARCEIWELTPGVCDLAAQVAPDHPLRTLDALHVATYLLARRRLGEVDLLTADRRVADAVGVPLDEVRES
jgi:predicted nucleic acid-binding protein